MGVESPGFGNQASTYGAEIVRRATLGFTLARDSSNDVGSSAGGLRTTTDLQLTPPGSGMTVTVSTGEAMVPGSSSISQGPYYCRASSSSSLAVAASNPSLPRIDSVTATVTDSAYSGGTNTFAVQVNTGTPTSGATLSNLNGAPALPTSSLLLGYVLVPAGATNIVSADIANIATQAVMGARVAAGAWTALTLGTGVTGGFGPTPSVRVDPGGVIRFKGQLFNNSGSTIAATTTLATIPASPVGLRPTWTMDFAAAALNNTVPVVTLGTGSNGVMALLSNLDAACAASLDGLTFTTS